MAKKWSKKYKRSIDCNNPKGFSQKAHCAGRKKRENVMSSKLEELVGKPITEEQFDEAAGKKDACYHKVKARYDVWPSAYASGALVKCRKVGAKNWGNKSKKEGVNEQSWHKDFKGYSDKELKVISKFIMLNDKGIDGVIKMSKKKAFKPMIKKMAQKGLHEGLDDLKALPKDLKKSIKKNREEGVIKENPAAIAAAQRMVVQNKSGNKISVNTARQSSYAQKDPSTHKKAKSLFQRIKDKFKKKESVDEARGTCWVGYQQVGMKKKGDRMVPNCVKEIIEIFYEENGEGHGYTFEHIKENNLQEAEYQGRKVKLGKIMQGDVKKFKVYVKNPKGNVVKVNFGQGGDAKGGTMRIRKSNPKARANFRARHNCDNPGPRHKARYWSCRKW